MSAIERIRAMIDERSLGADVPHGTFLQNCRERRMLAQVIDIIEEESGWRPITEDPKVEWQSVLLLVGCHHVVGYWDGEEWRADDPGFHCEGVSADCDPLNPTHSMPLPEPPEVKR